ncbi:MAG TPA: enoyl-CoA hydratase-related protein [Kofleriaceae bacterium]
MISVEKRAHVHTLVIDRPDARNALNVEVVTGLSAALDAAEADRECRVIVITGRGDKAFCAGGDLKGNPFASQPHDPRNPIAAMLSKLAACRLPIVARVNGHALAGGLGLLCACDLAVAVDTAKLGVPEVGVGVFPMMIMPFLTRVVPARRLMELCLTGDPITAQEALGYGLVNKVVPAAELDAATDTLVAKLVSRSPTAIRLGKQGAHAMRDMALAEALDYAQLMIGVMAQTKDSAEGLAAFREKRDPNWSGT